MHLLPFDWQTQSKQLIPNQSTPSIWLRRCGSHLRHLYTTPIQPISNRLSPPWLASSLTSLVQASSKGCTRPCNITKAESQQQEVVIVWGSGGDRLSSSPQESHGGGTTHWIWRNCGGHRYVEASSFVVLEEEYPSERQRKSLKGVVFGRSWSLIHWTGELFLEDWLTWLI